MAVTLADAKKLTQDKLYMGIIDEFIKDDLLNAMVFDDCVALNGGSTLAYTYNRVTTYPTAAFREINSEYTAQEASTTQYTTNLKIFGGSYKIDRVIQNDVRGITNQVAFQSEQKLKATKALFSDTFINGDSATDTKAFDGLDKALTGTSTEFNKTTAIDLSTDAAAKTNGGTFLRVLDDMLSELDGMPTAFLLNRKFQGAINSVARYSNLFITDKDEFGRPYLKYNGIPFFYVGNKPGTNTPIIGIDATAGTTDIYAVRLGIDGVHCVTPSGQPIITARLPKFDEAGAVKEGDVEMVAAMVMKATKSAGVVRKIQIAPKTTSGGGQ